MKLYKEVKASGDCITYYTPRGYPIHLEPIEITEATRELWKNHCSMGNHGEYMSWDDFVGALSKLGE